MKDKDRLQICWQAFSMENSLLQSYRMLFMMVEAVLLALAYVLLVPLKGPLIWVAASLGWGIVAIWITICEAKGRDVDRWMKRIVGFQSIVEKDWSIVGKDWFDYLKLGVKLPGGRLARILFNWITPLSIAGLWILVVRAALN